MKRRLQDRVLAITGASSGIGRAVALAAARRGDAVVLIARRADALAVLAGECRAAGGRALPVTTDVTRSDQVDAAARAALETFGRLDGWINNAAVTLFGRLEDVPLADVHRVIETNLFGYVHGARAALRVFREQGSGVLVQVSSVVADLGQPLTSAYVASKWAIRGLSASLRQELLDAPGIHVCTVLPSAVDTPIFRQAANYTGRAPRPVAPVLTPEQVAAAILGALDRPRREIRVGAAARATFLGRWLAPRFGERMMARTTFRDHFADESAPPGSGNLHEPRPEWACLHGGFGAERARRGPRLAAAAVLVAVGTGAFLLARRGR